ncbi:HET-domain-containing protein [Apiospora kogelbergensis]|uniref:HET-domain-containing protein n=1 Tax=Apiospora kogelbergensis TaxID=1337665 RepID=UPI00312F7FE4
MATEASTDTFDISILKEWIRVCDECHGSECHAEPISERPQHSVPDWVIVTENHCIVPGSSDQKYAALSYTWQRHGYLTTGVLENIPAVVKDSINLVRLSKIRYLWVDCLCIVQYDETTQDRVSHMGEIYSGAYLTIMAAGHNEGLQGLQHNYDQYVLDGYNSYSPKGYPSLERLHSSLLRSRWASRGWTFQEQLLAKRSLIFLDDLFFWDCQSKTCFTGPGGEHSPLDGHPDYRMAVASVEDEPKWRTLGPLSPIPDFRLFVELVCRYSNRNLTYDQDTLPAFSGVLDAFAQSSFRGGFISGLPSLFLDASLIWQPLFKARRRSPVNGVSKFAPMASLPSWSWVGWQCLLDPGSLASGESYSWFIAQKNLWTTKKLVDWCTYSHDGVLQPITEPSVLEGFQDYRTTSCNKPLPSSWTRKTAAKTLYSGYCGNVTSWPEAEGFVHDSQPETFYQYPLPLSEASCAGMTVRNHVRLSCITTKATLRARRILTATIVRKRPTPLSMMRVPVVQTELYKFKPDPEKCCPVVSLEDGQGRWAGTLRVMDNEASIQPQDELELIAVSTASAPGYVVDRAYEESVDCTGNWVYGRKPPYLVSFISNPECLQPQGRFLDLPGPMDGRRIPEVYFYNVLWVKVTDGIMYRQAVGRVLKEVWEQNCEKPERIVLG